MRRFIVFITGIAWTLAAMNFLSGGTALAAEYPAKEIRIIQPYPAGGFNDVTIRKMVEIINKKKLMDRDIIAVSITGANTRNALNTVLDAPADGYTLLMHHTAFVATKVSGQLNIGYTDFDMIGGLLAGPIAFNVNKDSRWTDIRQVVDDIKAHPRKFRMALPGTGGTAHIAMLHFLKLVGIPVKSLNYLPLSGGSETLKAVLGNEVDLRVATAADAMRSDMSGETRSLVVLSHKSLPAFAGVTTLKDMNLEDSLHIDMGLFAPKGTPQEIKDFWARILKEVAADPEFIKFANERGSVAAFVPPDQWTSVYERDTRLVEDILKK